MKIKISNQNIKTLSAGWYADVKYLQMHIGKSQASWYYGRSFHGKFYRVTLGRYPETSRAEAIAQVEHLSENLRRFGNLEGIGAVQHGHEYTLADAWRLYSSWRTIDKQTQQRFDLYLKQWSEMCMLYKCVNVIHFVSKSLFAGIPNSRYHLVFD